MSGKIVSYFHHRTKEDIFFGSLDKYTEAQIMEIVKLYLQDVIKFLFNEIPNNRRVFVPINGLNRISKEFSIPEVKFSFAGKYIIFESNKNNPKIELIEQVKFLFSSNFPLSHLKYSIPSLEHSFEPFDFTPNCIKLQDILPFPSYIIWAFRNQGKSRFKISNEELDNWSERTILQLRRINIVPVNEDIITFSIETKSTIAKRIQELY